MKKSKKLNFIVPLVIYPFDILVSMGQTDEELNKVLSKYDCCLGEGEAETYNRPAVQGRTIMNANNQSVIRFKKIPETCEEYGVLAHEIFHVVTYVMNRVDMKLKLQSSDEAYAYAIGYLTTKIYEKINQ